MTSRVSCGVLWTTTDAGTLLLYSWYRSMPPDIVR